MLYFCFPLVVLVGAYPSFQLLNYFVYPVAKSLVANPSFPKNVVTIAKNPYNVSHACCTTTITLRIL